MKKPTRPSDSADLLRRRAEERLARATPQGGPPGPDADAARLIHELQVHQIELELQNDELQQSRARVETLLAQYADLYDFAPTGYLTIDPGGVIRQVNLAGARLFGVDRSRLVAQRIDLRVAPGDRADLLAFLQRVFASSTVVHCELVLQRDGAPPAVVRIEGARSTDGEECRAMLFDITERKAVEAERERLLVELQATQDEVKTLKGLLPICASCKKIRDDDGFWNQIEAYITQHSDAHFSHGICPECLKRLYPEFGER